MKLIDIPGLELLGGTPLHRMRKARSNEGIETRNITTISSAAIGNGLFISSNFGDETIPAKNIDDSRMSQLGDVIIKTTSPFCCVYLYEEQLTQKYILSSCIICRINDKANTLINPAYLAGYLNMPPIQERLQSTSSGSTLTLLKKSALEQFDIPLLPIQKQEELGAIYKSCVALRLDYMKALHNVNDIHEAAFSDAMKENL